MTPKISEAQSHAGPLQDKDANTNTPVKGTRISLQWLLTVNQHIEQDQLLNNCQELPTLQRMPMVRSAASLTTQSTTTRTKVHQAQRSKSNLQPQTLARRLTPRKPIPKRTPPRMNPLLRTSRPSSSPMETKAKSPSSTPVMTSAKRSMTTSTASPTPPKPPLPAH